MANHALSPHTAAVNAQPTRRRVNAVTAACRPTLISVEADPSCAVNSSFTCQPSPGPSVTVPVVGRAQGDHQ